MRFWIVQKRMQRPPLTGTDNRFNIYIMSNREIKHTPIYMAGHHSIGTH
ncbi:hypothetical protein GCM10007867_00260 [Gluconobacter cerinus]|uniref:Uncharacterized protein n=1 Tax=Gluconobacter cerinus TaxID=38307 RepID=A0AAV5N8W8_9PROT|nr:hypothetical protein GCM10007867_00260 [Gluconobacter cerinus]